MSRLKLINDSCLFQDVDAIVNAANKYLQAGSGICGAIFENAGHRELQAACDKIKTPLCDGDAVITPSFSLKNCDYIIHAVGPNFSVTPDAFDKLELAYFNSLKVLMQNNLHSIAFPLISSGIFGGNQQRPAYESAKMCQKAFARFREEYKGYEIDVLLCAFSKKEMEELSELF